MPEQKREIMQQKSKDLYSKNELNQKNSKKDFVILKYIKLMNMLLISCVLYFFISTISTHLNFKESNKIIEQYFLSNTSDRISFLTSNFNHKELSEKHYQIAEKELFSLKNELIFIDVKDALQKSGLNEYSSNRDSKIFNEKLELTQEAKDKYQQFVNLQKAPISKEKIAIFQKAINNADKMNALLNERSKINPEVKKHFITSLRDVKFIIESKDGIDIINTYRANLDNEEFQKLILEQQTDELWSKYFKGKFGDSVSPIAHLKDGTFSYDLGKQ